MKLFVTSSLLLATCLAHPTRREEKAAAAPKITDVDILQYALTLEHLEDKFYREGLANFTLDHFLEAGYDGKVYSNIKEISYDETTHVDFLTKALKAANATPVQECTYAFGVTDVDSFLMTASILEGVGVSAYLGAAASIMEKAYLTAAGSILTVESRHSSYLRAAQHQSPFPQAFDAPLDLNQVYTLAAPFIVTCPQSNGMLPVKAFPALSLVPATAEATTNATIVLETKQPFAMNSTEATLYAAWIGVTGATFAKATLKGDDTIVTVVPPGVKGESYVVLTTNGTVVTDDNTVAGPAIVQVMGASGMMA